MASLLNLTTGETMHLLAQHIAGRHQSSCNLLLENPKASRLHATFLWNGEHWLLHDNSSNGTYINNARLVRDSSQLLQCGDEINFVTPDTDTWKVADIEPPKSMLIPETPGIAVIFLDGIVVLPDETSPLVTVFQALSGQWMCESEFGTRVMVDGEEVGGHGKYWRFSEAPDCAETQPLDHQELVNLSDISVYFNASQDEEHIWVKLTINGEVFDLGERNHHYLLLLLARQYGEDKAAGLFGQDRGWIDKDLLAKMFQQSEVYINMLIYRFRKQILKTLPEHLLMPQLIERRKGEVRLYCNDLKIDGGTQLV